MRLGQLLVGPGQRVSAVPRNRNHLVAQFPATGPAFRHPATGASFPSDPLPTLSNMCSLPTTSEPPPPTDPEQPKRSLEQLEREICELAAHLAAATCRWLLLLGEFDERLGWAEWGVVSCAHWLSWRCGIGLGAARQHVRVAKALRQLPLLREAFASGELSYSKARAITRVATPAIEGQLVELARHATGAQLEKLVRGYRSALAVSTSAAHDSYVRRALRHSWEDDGSLRLDCRLPAEDGALLLKALAMCEHVSADHPGPGRKADALVALARTALTSADADGRAHPCELVIHIDSESLTGERISEQAQLEDGPALAPETVRRLGCDAAAAVIIERDGKPVASGKRTRTIAPALRRALRARDRGCAFPGCTHTRYLHAHHIHHWARGGPTTLSNLVQLCSHHHRLVHEGGYQVSRARRGQLRFCRPNGTPIARVPTPPGASGPPLERQRGQRDLAIDAKTCMPRSAGDSIDYGIAVEGLLIRVLKPG